METMYIKPVCDNWSRDNSITGNVIALYESDAVNVGYPSIAPYQPALGNMWGYGEAVNKGYFEVLDNNTLVETIDAPVYVIGVDESRKVMQFIQPVNEQAKNAPIFGSNNNKVTSIVEEQKKLKRVL